MDGGRHNATYSIKADVVPIIDDCLANLRAIRADQTLAEDVRSEQWRAEMDRCNNRLHAVTRKTTNRLLKSKTLKNWKENKDEHREAINRENVGPNELSWNEVEGLLREAEARVHGKTIMEAAPAFRMMNSLQDKAIAWVNDHNRSAADRFSISNNIKSHKAKLVQYNNFAISHKEFMGEGFKLRHTKKSRERRRDRYDARGGPLNLDKKPRPIAVYGDASVGSGRGSVSGFSPEVSR